MTDSSELKKQLDELAALVSSLNETMTPHVEAVNNLKADSQRAYQEYLALNASNNQKIKAYTDAMENARRKIGQAERDISSKQYQYKALVQQEEKAAREADRADDLLLLNQKWDRLTAAASWREWSKDHQIKAGHFLTENRKVIFADPMGLGKTLSVIIACDMIEKATKLASPSFPFLAEEREQYDYATSEYTKVLVNGIERPVGKRVLYFCPPALIRNVMSEYRMWANHRSVTYIGGMSKAERQFALPLISSQPEFVLICNYEAWRKDTNLLQELIDLDFDTIILDEAHNLKDSKTSAYRGIKKIIEQAKPEYVIPMTGTPILNRPQELFSLLSLILPETFYHLNTFLRDFCEQDDDGHWHFQPGGLDRVANRISKNFLRRTRDQAGIILPEKTIIHHDLEVDLKSYPAQAEAREHMKTYAQLIVNEEKGQVVTAAAVIAMYTRLRQIETWPAGIQVINPKTKEVEFALEVEESQKIDYVISTVPDTNGVYSGLIPDIVEDERIVVFSQFKAPLKELSKRISAAGYRPVILDGETSADDREAINKDFDRRYTSNRSDSKWDVVLCNYRVGGVGLNLTAATQMIILDEEWNPGKRDQAYDRIHRIGQEEAVTINVIRNQKTIDDWLAGIMENKEGLVDGFNNHMSSVSGLKEFLDDGGFV